MFNQPVIDVACGIVCHQGKVLVAQRGPAMSQPLKWEFPGGKLEPGESVERCLQRELFEELGIEVELRTRLPVSEYDYGTFTIRLHPVVAEFARGNILLSEHLDFAWTIPESLVGFDWAPADIPVVELFLQHIAAS